MADGKRNHIRAGHYSRDFCDDMHPGVDHEDFMFGPMSGQSDRTHGDFDKTGEGPPLSKVGSGQSDRIPRTDSGVARGIIHVALTMAGYSPAQADARIAALLQEASAAPPAPPLDVAAMTETLRYLYHADAACDKPDEHRHDHIARGIVGQYPRIRGAAPERLPSVEVALREALAALERIRDELEGEDR